MGGTDDRRRRSRRIPFLAVIALGLQGLDALRWRPAGGRERRRVDSRPQHKLRPNARACCFSRGHPGSVAPAALQSRSAGVFAASAAGSLQRSASRSPWSGHASDAEPHIVTKPAVAIHAMALTFWLGSLLPLVAALRASAGSNCRSPPRFSRWIPVPLALLVVTCGVLLAFLQVRRTPAAMGWIRGTGWILDGKLVLFAGSCSWLRPRTGFGSRNGHRGDGDASARRRNGSIDPEFGVDPRRPFILGLGGWLAIHATATRPGGGGSGRAMPPPALHCPCTRRAGHGGH